MKILITRQVFICIFVYGVTFILWTLTDRSKWGKQGGVKILRFLLIIDTIWITRCCNPWKLVKLEKKGCKLLKTEEFCQKSKNIKTYVRILNIECKCLVNIFMCGKVSSLPLNLSEFERELQIKGLGSELQCYRAAVWHLTRFWGCPAHLTDTRAVFSISPVPSLRVVTSLVFVFRFTHDPGVHV